MAKRTVETITDDLDGTDISADASSVRLSFDGAHVELDLSPAHRTELVDALAPYIAAGRRLPKTPRRR